MKTCLGNCPFCGGDLYEDSKGSIVCGKCGRAFAPLTAEEHLKLMRSFARMERMVNTLLDTMEDWGKRIRHLRLALLQSRSRGRNSSKEGKADAYRPN